MNGMLRFLSLLLVFILGFMACAGSLVLGGLYIYKCISYEKLEGWGVPVPAPETMFESNADVRLTALTMEELVREVQKVMEKADVLTINRLIDRYGAKIPQEILDLLPPAMLNLPLDQIASSDGIQTVLEQTTLGYVLGLAPGMITEPATVALQDKSLMSLLEMDVATVFADMELGYLMEVTYAKYPDGTFKLTYIDAENPTTSELTAPLNVGDALDAIMNGGDIWGVVKRDIGDVELSRLIADDSSNIVNALTEERTLADVIIYDAAVEKHGLSLEMLTSGLCIGDIAGWTPIYDEADPELILYWEKSPGVRATGALAALADLTLDELTDDAVQEAVDGMYLYDALGYTYNEEEGAYYNGSTKITGILSILAPKKVSELDTGIGEIYIGEIMGWEPVYTDPADPTSPITGWLDGSAPATGIMASFAGLTVDEMSNETKVQATIDNMYLYDVLGYTYNEEEGAYYKGETKVTGILNVLAPKKVSEMNDGIGQIYLGEIMGWEPVYTDPADPTSPITGWLDGSAPATGIMASFASLTVDEMSDEDKVQAAVNDLYLYDVLGYTEQGDGTYKDQNSDAVTGIMGALAGNKVSQISGAVADLTLQDVFSESELNTGFLSLLDPQTRLYPDADSSAPGLAQAVTDAFTNACLGEVLVGEDGSAELIELDANTQAALNTMDTLHSMGEGTYYRAKADGTYVAFNRYWKTLTLAQLITYMATDTPLPDAPPLTSVPTP